MGSSPVVNLAIRTRRAYPAGGAPQRSEAAPHVVLGRRPVADRHPEHGPVVPARAGHPGGPVVQHRLHHRLRAIVVAEGRAHLGEDDVVEHLGALDVVDALGQGGRVVAEPVDQVGDAVAAQGAQHRPHREGPPAAADLGHLVERLPRLVVDQVVAVHAHRRPERGPVPDDGEPAVVGDVEGLVGVGGPRVGLLDARDQVPTGARRGREQAEGAVDVHPCVVLVGERDRLGEGVEGARVDVARLEHDEVGRPSPASRAAARAAGSIRPSPSTATGSGAPSPR